MKEILAELFEFNRRIRHGEVLSEADSERFLELKAMADEFIGSIDNDYVAECLTQRYIKANPWASIADDMGQLTNEAVRKCCSRAIKRYS